ncbi:MAG: 2Fe-2S iron-sulfur cluster-binding protein [Alphaproteobacteria bacterium]|mgnify:CR=1 FL=1|jgi:succinate dehydrogenase/fumarate reductase-like Fe-S protein|nr:2Fe-2S iron-sulfur cluster-binding protein [Alphaproteobacteria bacterium]MDP6563373.1 2Fe-2S iron-sulfur cluster-binding protein [Alphaproteobacteria bacterium]MDP6812145.1 2Fe-2S iron-sulfur cluster-binding protein [Alphaproteobacteria bacterium]
MTTQTARINIQRGAPGDPARIESYQVPYREGMSVLDALIWIRANRDASLAVRYSCTNANTCKECLVEVDGKAAYACTARLGRQPVTVAPLGNKKLIRDLVTDTAPPKETLRYALGEG